MVMVLTQDTEEEEDREADAARDGHGETDSTSRCRAVGGKALGEEKHDGDLQPGGGELLDDAKGLRTVARQHPHSKTACLTYSRTRSVV